MSKTKEFYFNGSQDEPFVTDDTYNDFLQMQRHHHEQQELESLQEEINGAAQNRSMSSKQKSFFQNEPNDLPF